MDKILENFSKIYTALDTFDSFHIIDYSGEVAEHDEKMKTDRLYNYIVRRLAEKRGDLFTSDRECAAIWLAIKAHHENIEV